MQVTDVRVKLTPPGKDRLCGFCTITLDASFVVRDIKIIDGPNGVFVAMPSRKLMDHCPSCMTKNHLRARYCNHCGQQLNENRHARMDDTRVKLHSDVAHPINAECRALVHRAILTAYHQESERSKLPGYVPHRLEDVAEPIEA
jgi:stage V sporulation protein G